MKTESSRFPIRTLNSNENGSLKSAIFFISSLDVVITSLDYIVVLIRRYVFGGLGLVFMLSLLVTIVVKGKSVENDYLEQLATELELSVCEKTNRILSVYWNFR